MKTTTAPWLFLMLFLALALALARPGLKAAESIQTIAGMSFPAVQEAGSARAIGMGSTYVGVAEGSATLPHNPAGLANMKAMEVALHHNGTVEGSFQETVTFAMPLPGPHGIGASLNYTDHGDFEGRDTSGNLLPDYQSRAFGASVGWGGRLTPKLAVGAALKANRQDLAGTAMDAVAADLGALWSLANNLTLGAAYTNLGVEAGGSRLAQGLNLGASLYLAKGTDMQWLLAVSDEALAAGDNTLRAGLEFKLNQMLALRGGYGFRTTYTDMDAVVGLTLGLGVSLENLTLDYAFVPLAEAGSVQRLSLTYAFAGSR
jgi:hypothetical protein